jgi:radical SAM protein (TIGR01212 family)
MLVELARNTWLLIEFGVQTIHDRTLDRLNRGHHFAAFKDAFARTHARDLDVGVHVILGLPGESDGDMRATAKELARYPIHSLKLHNLYAVHGTRLAEQVASGEVRLPTLEEHVCRVVDFLEETPAACVIDRISGDAPPEYLVGPAWCRNKTAIRAAVDAEFRRRGTWQGWRCQKRDAGQ